MKLALDKASQNLGSTKENPSVGCVIVNNGSVISSGVTSLNGRPHAETNALNSNKIFNGSTMYVTLEPCTHYGKTSPCVDMILKKRIKKVYYPILDFDKRTHNRAKKILNKNNIKVKIGILKKDALNFYKSYFLFKNKKIFTICGCKDSYFKRFLISKQKIKVDN